MNTVRTGIATAAIAAFTLASIAPAEGFDLQGHRGARGLLPENTLASFRKAIEIDPTFSSAYHLLGNAYIGIGHYDEAIEWQALKAGALGFLRKPFSDEVLVGLIRKALQGRQTPCS